MKEDTLNRVIFLAVAGIMIFAPIFKGAVNLFPITVIEIVLLSIMFIWLFSLNNKYQRDDIRYRRYSKIKFYPTEIDLPVLIFLLLAILSSCFSFNKYISFTECMRMAGLAGLYYLVVNTFNRKRAVNLAKVIVMTGAVLSLYGLAQYFFGLNHSWWNPPRFLASTYVNHNHFAGYLELTIPLAAGLFFGSDKKPLDGIIYISAFVIMCLALIYSLSRGAVLSLMVSILVMNLALISRKVMKKWTFIVIIGIFITGAAYLASTDSAFSKRIKPVESIEEDDFIGGRIKVWTGALGAFRENYLTGTGPGTFVWEFTRFRPERLRTRTYYAHNEYLHMMVEMGFIVLPFMLWMLIVVIRNGLRRIYVDRFYQIDGVLLGGGIGILSLACHAMVDFNFHITANILAVVCVAGIIMGKARD